MLRKESGNQTKELPKHRVWIAVLVPSPLPGSSIDEEEKHPARHRGREMEEASLPEHWKSVFDSAAFDESFYVLETSTKVLSDVADPTF